MLYHNVLHIGLQHFQTIGITADSCSRVAHPAAVVYAGFRLRLFAGLGLALFGLGIGLGLLLLVGSVLGWFVVSGWVVVIWVVLMLAGLQMLFLAVMSEYIGKLFLAQSGQKAYVLKKNVRQKS